MVGSFRILSQASNGDATFAWSHGVRETVGPAHRMVPFWYLSLVIWRTWSQGGELADIRLRLHGPQPRTYTYAPREPVELIGVAIAPEVSRFVLGIDNREVSGQIVDWHDPRFDGALRLAAGGAEADAIASAIDLPVREALMGRCRSGIDHTIAILRRMKGTVPIRRIRARAGMSERHFRKSFLDRLGISPKAYSRLVRVNSLVQEADRSKTPSWADLATQFGYFDQSHMINEIRELTGCTPSVLDMERRAASSASCSSGVSSGGFIVDQIQSRKSANGPFPSPFV